MEVRIIKGTNQIGGCITEISTKNTKIIIDFGTDLDEARDFEISGLTKDKSIYDAVFITHSHLDHIGLINKINDDILVFVEEKSLQTYNLTCDFCNNERIKKNINTFKLQKNIDDIKPIFDNGNIKVIPFIIDHSAYNSCMYLIEADGKKILHTGDFRNHGRKGILFELMLKKIGKVDLLITEGTSLSREDKTYLKEVDLEKEAKEIMDKYDQVFILQSSTNVDRTVSFLKASLKSSKKFVMDLFSYHINKIINLNIDVDYKNIFVWKPIKYRFKSEDFKQKYLDMNTSSNIFPYFTMEVKQSMLKDIKMLYNKGVLSKACLIYSMWDGYIEKEEKLKSFIDEMKKMNIDFIELHTSGHADIKTMKWLNEIVNPDYTIIIHTENSKSIENIFNNVLDLEDGKIFEIKE